jgi:hypothetical protein
MPGFWQKKKEEGHSAIVPGESPHLTSKIMESGQALVQSFKPLKRVCEHVCGLHFYDGDLSRQLIAHHYCSHLNEDVRQCVIYDSSEPDARLIGIEYIISRQVFEKLPEDEKKYWHSHVYEVKSGMLVAPQVPEKVERMAMGKLIDTYGKTWHTWQVDRGDRLPLGEPRLMMAFTRDGQVDRKLLAEKDRLTNISSQERRQQREGIKEPEVLPGADKGLLIY